MAAHEGQELTELLCRAGQGDRGAADRAIEALYEELRRNARILMRSRPHQTLDASAVLHEAWMKVHAAGKTDWESRGHFLAVMSRAMRQVLLDDAKRKRRVRHGGELQRVPLSGILLRLGDADVTMDAVHAAIEAVGRQDPSAARIIELTYFVGLTGAECASALGVASSTVERELKWARTLLKSELTG